MAIESISRDDFARHNLVTASWAVVIGEEKSWFKDATGKRLGVVILDPADNTWTYVMLEKAEGGEFRAADAQSCIATQAEAEVQLQTDMEKP